MSCVRTKHDLETPHMRLLRYELLPAHPTNWFLGRRGFVTQTARRAMHEQRTIGNRWADLVRTLALVDHSSTGYERTKSSKLIG